MRIRYSEIFFSFQGEAELAGTPSVWLRFFGCNLNCNGFGQKDPTDPSTYILPYENFDASNVKDVNSLPVWQYGCDSSYSWSQKYKHLAKDNTASEIAQLLINELRNNHNQLGKFVHPSTNQDTQLCFTGGEPMLNQKAMIAILRELHAVGNMPRIITVETNATKKLSDELRDFINNDFREMGGKQWHWSMSPKLFSVSGENNVVYPANIYDYARHTISTAILKFVCDGSTKSWDELTAHLHNIRIHFGYLDIPKVWIMPVGATKDDQEKSDIGDICIEAMQRGYNVATRNHVYVWGNCIGR